MRTKLVIAFFAAFVALMFPVVSALSVTTQDAGSVIIKELGNPAVFQFNISSASADSIGIFNFLGFTVSPHGNFDISPGMNSVQVKFYPSQDLLQNNGFYDFQYQLNSQASGLYTGNLRVKFVSLGDAVAVNVDPIEVGSDSAVVHVKNTQNAYLENMQLTYSSPFFRDVKTLSLSPYEEQSFNVSIDKVSAAALSAGQYIVTGSLNIGSANASVSSNFEYLEQENLTSSSASTGFIVRKTSVTETNNGNLDSQATLKLHRDVFSRLFTTFSSDPISSDRSGLEVNYVWQRTLKPGESYTVTASTNYTFPFLIIILAVAIILFVRLQQRNSMTIRKNVSFVKAKGGEFALKVTLYARANKYVENAQLIDTLPQSLKLFDKFGKKPDKIDVASRRMFWELGNLGEGEERVFSYIAYSKIKVVGRFELPAALAVFSKDGKPGEAFSNRAFFASEITSTEG